VPASVLEWQLRERFGAAATGVELIKMDEAW
jgi:hypothetical protein